MPFSKSPLAPAEKPVFQTRQHIFVILLPALLNLTALVLLIVLSTYTKRLWLFVFYVVPIIGFLLEFLAWKNRSYTLTDTRIIKREGVLSANTSDIPLDTIKNIFLKKSIPGRLLRYGNICVETSAGKEEAAIFHCLVRPEDFMNQIIDRRESLRNRMEINS